MKKIGKAIARKFKNWKGSKKTTTQDQSVSSREEAKKPLEITIEQQPTVVTAKTTTAKDENSKEVCKYSVTNKDTTRVKATETDSKLCESEDLQPISESSEEAQNDSTTVEQTSVDRADSPSSAEPCFDSDDAEEKPSTRQRQAIVAGIIGAALLVSSVVAYILKIYAIAVVGGIVGLACVSYALYDTFKPNTKLEKVGDIEQSIIAHPPLNEIISLEKSLNH